MRHVYASQKQHNRKGSVLLLVIALLGMLLLAGIAFYTFASSENISAEYFADAAKVLDDTPNDVFEFGLEQLILGPRTQYTKSALYGRRHSLLGTMMGLDQTGQHFTHSPFNGQGIMLAANGVGGGYTITNPAAAGLLKSNGIQVNFSGAAAGAISGQAYPPSGNTPVAVPVLPATDVDYTYPDINNIYLAYLGTTPTSAGNPDIPVITPSFLSPIALRNPNGGGIPPDWTGVDPTTGNLTNQNTAQLVMRPHPFHVNPSGTTYRFLSTQSPLYQSGLGGAQNVLGQTVKPFPFTQNNTLNLGVWDPTYSGGVPATVSLDSDNDNDGVKEGIWMDLDYPVQQLADGRFYIPLFSYTVIDADALLNLNVVGDLAGAGTGNVPANLDSNPSGQHAQFLSKSNMGLSRSEINPEWAFIADPQNNFYSTNYTSDIQQYLTWWGNNNAWGTSGAPTSRNILANMELTALCWGNTTFTSGSGNFNFPVGNSYSPDKYIQGRWTGGVDLTNFKSLVQNGPGAGGAIMPNLIPYPGTSGFDDDYDVTAGFQRPLYWSPALATMNLPTNTLTAPFSQPLDYQGNGLAASSGLNGVQAALQTSGFANSPARWPYYASGYQYSGQYAGGAAQTYFTPLPTNPYYTWIDGPASTGGSLFPAAVGNGNVDEADEAVAEASLANSNDAMFTVDELGGLFLSNTDQQNNSITSRLQSLMPWSLRDNLLAKNPPPPKPNSSFEYSIRTQFTPYSYDRTQYGNPLSISRTWEYNADSNQNGRLEFPPVYLAANATNPAILSGGTNEPFRWQLRQLLTAEVNNTQSNWMQLRLDLNNYLASTTYDSYLGRTVPVYRAPTPHPIGMANTPATTLNNPNYPPTTVNDQEWWARYDRQQMARDIFVLLYTLAFPPTQGTHQSPGTSLYPDLTGNGYALIDQMAQFAVNYVDAVDPDNVMTRFEYCPNLAAGWNLDDNPYTVDTSDTTARREVWGVEAQQLTISEAQVIYAPTIKPDNVTPTDDPASQYSDKLDHYFTYIELQNVSPFPVNLNNGATNTSSGVWQIQMTAQNSGGGLMAERRLTMIDGSVPAAQMFTIGSVASVDTTAAATLTKDTQLQDASGNPLPSYFKVDANYNGTPKTTAAWQSFDPIAPLGATTAGQSESSGMTTSGVYPTGVGTNYMDLVNFSQAAPATSFQLSQGQTITDPTIPAYYNDGAVISTTPNPGDFVWTNTVGSGATVTSITFALRRRANPHRIPPDVNNGMSNSDSQAADNPWVEVDRFTITPGNGYTYFNMKLNDSQTPAMTTPTNLQTKLTGVTSSERREAFMRTATQAGVVTVEPYALNSLGVVNNATTNNGLGYFAVWQPHFDRDFSSAYDLLTMPLYGPNNVTNYLSDATTPSSNLPTVYSQPQGVASTAHQKFMQPIDTSGLPQYSNYWYRLLEFVEVPTRTQLASAARLTSDFQPTGARVPGPRVPGGINLNTMRHRGVMAALIDDPVTHNNPVNTTPPFDGNGHLDPQYGSGSIQNMLYDNYDNTNNSYYTSNGGTVTRDWWAQMIMARDGVFSGSGAPPVPDLVSGLYLPGVPGSRPFRSLGYSDDGTASIEHTILRRLPMDGGGNYQQQRQIFEARGLLDVSSGQVDHYTRYRLLRKMANNSTTRSNVFIVWLTVQNFEAVPNSNNEFTIGDVLSGSPPQRGFFVVDRSLPEQAYNQQTGNYNYSKFVVYRKTLQ
jgi:hypothetical protein